MMPATSHSATPPFSAAAQFQLPTAEHHPPQQARQDHPPQEALPHCPTLCTAARSPLHKADSHPNLGQQAYTDLDS